MKSSVYKSRPLTSALVLIPLLSAAVTSAQAADAWNGKSLYNLSKTGVSAPASCAAASCHGSAPPLTGTGLNKIGNGRNNPALIRSAISGNAGGMGKLVWNDLELADIAAYIGNPNVTAPAPGPTPTPAGSASPGSLSFSTTLPQASAAQAVTLTNTGNVALTITSSTLNGTNPTEFAIASASCVNGGSVALSGTCTVNITFNPVSAGTKSANLAILHAGGTANVSLSGNASAAAVYSGSASPTTLTYGSTVINTASSTQSITFSNNGNVALPIASSGLVGGNSGEFKIVSNTCTAGSQVATSGNCTVGISFNPLTIGAKSTAMQIAHSGGTASVTLNGSAADTPKPTLGINTTSLAFGNVVQNQTSAAQRITIDNNAGTAPLVLSGLSLSAGAGAANYFLGGTCTATSTINTGASCYIDVSFNPKSIAALNGTLTINSNASNNNAVGVSLTGSGVAVPAPVVTVGPASLAFGNQQINLSSNSQVVTIQNTGTAAATLGAPAIAGAGMTISANTCVTSLAVNSSCTVSIVYTPVAVGANTGSLSITSNAPGSPYSVNLSGTGSATPTPKPTISQTALHTFAATTVGQKTAVFTATVGNSGTASFKLASLGITGSNPSDFSLGAGSCDTVTAISSTNTCSVSVAFNPTAVGLRTANLSIVTDSGTTLGFGLQGTGNAIAVTQGALGTATLDFGPILVGNTTNPSLIMVNNTGNTDLVVSSVVVATPFAIATDSTGCGAGVLPFTVKIGTSCNIAVKAKPTAAVASTATLTIKSNAPADMLATLKVTGSAVPVAVAPPVVVPPTVTPPTGSSSSSSSSSSSGAPASSSGMTGTVPATPPTATASGSTNPPVLANEAATPFNAGAGGCSVSQDGSDISLVLLLLAALFTAMLRRNASKQK